MPVPEGSPEIPGCNNSEEGDEVTRAALNDLVVAMGRRLQSEYVEGAIPYLRTHESELWSRLEMLDREETLEALLEYERLFFEGLRRYVFRLEEQRKAA